jgi:bacteriorhodopsin
MLPESMLHWLYVAVMLLGALIFFVWSQNRRGVPREEYVVAMFIPLWSAAAYTALALGQGKIEVDGQITYVARYLDWVVTTPLLLLALSMTAFFKVEKDYTLIASLMGADVIMILSGLIADLSTEPARYIWYGIGVVAFVVIMYLLWVPLRTKALEHPEARIGSIFTRSLTYLTVFWFGYPLTWIIGPSGLNLVSQEVDTLLFVVLPVFSKVGFSLFDLSMLRNMNMADSVIQRQPLSAR